MNAKEATIVVFLSAVMGTAAQDFVPVAFASATGEPQETAQATVVRRIGAIKTISGSTITLAVDSGLEIAVTVQPTARIVQVSPGEKNLKNATPIQFSDLHVGDRILVGGKASDDAKSIDAASIVAMKASDVEARHEQERQDWQKRGMGGLVSAVDPATGTVTISVTGFGGTKSIAVHTSKSTVIRRYAPDSVKFDDAKPSTLQEVKPGDQLRARGDRSADGSELTADEIVTGNFHNIAGTVNSVDASAGTISVQDLLSKKAVQVKITTESQLHKLPAEIAQRIAMRLKGAMPPGVPGTAGSPAATAAGTAAAYANGAQSGAPAEGMRQGGQGIRGGAPDFQQMLSRMPAVAVADLHKGDAVMIVTTEGTSSSVGTAITLLSGVEPILQAAPNGSQAMMLAPWSLGSAPADAGSQ